MAKRNVNKGLTGRVDFQNAVADEKSEFVTMNKDTFSITVKDDDGKAVYKNDNEPYEYPQVDSIANYLRYKGAKMSDDQIQFLGEALQGEGTGEVVKSLIEDLNGLLQAKAKQSAYSKVFNEHKPVSEESLENSRARMVRDFIRQNGGTIAPESAIEVLRQFVPTMKDYTLEMFNANKGRV